MRKNIPCVGKNLFLRAVPLHFDPCIILRVGKHLLSGNPARSAAVQKFTHAEISAFERIATGKTSDRFARYGEYAVAKFIGKRLF